MLLICKYPNRNFCLPFISIYPVCSPQLISTSPLSVNSVPFMPHFLDFYSRANVLIYSTMFPIEFISGPWHSLCSIVNKPFFFSIVVLFKENLSLKLTIFSHFFFPMEVFLPTPPQF